MKTAVEWLVEEVFGTILIGDLLLKKIQRANEIEKENIIKHSVELSKILMNNPIEISGKTHQELITDYFKNKFKNK